MRFAIESTNDLTAGTAYTVRVPEGQVDWNALYTMQRSMPEFVVPFFTRNVDGALELCFRAGSYSRLQYLSARRPAKEYEELWYNLLSPLFDCEDWFMQAFSFVTDPDYLFMDMKTQRIRYLYIPSVEPCTDFDTLRRMLMEVARQNPCTDGAVESAVIRTLSGDFSPRDLLRQLKGAAPEPARSVPQAARVPAAPRERPAEPSPAPERREPPSPAGQGAESGGARQKRTVPDDKDDIIIQLFDGPHLGDPEEEPPRKHGLFGGKRANKKEAKKEPKKEKKGGLFARKKAEAALPADDDFPPAPKPEPKPKPQLQPAPRKQLAPQPPQQRQPQPAYPVGHAAGTGGTGFRLVGDERLPRMISIRINEGETFRIGRFDVTVGVQQSDFEFDKRTREVSRRHAVVERKPDGYVLIDLVSKAGTYIDGEVLAPNVPYPLRAGCRVSFGHAGADYIWQE